MKLKRNNFLGITNGKYHLDNCSISVVNYSKPVSEEWHSHEDIHLSLILQGGNKESRKKEDKQVIPGNIIGYHQGEVHRNRFTAFPSKNLNFEFKNGFFNKTNLAFGNLDLSETKSAETYLDLLKIYNELRINDICTVDVIQYSLESLFTNNNLSSHIPIWLTQLREIIEDRWNEFVSLQELSFILNVHPVTISKYFKKHFKCSLGDYMRKIKVRKALHLLFDSHLSITEIAHTCGFSDHSHMIRVFKMYVGYNPKSIRGL